MNKKGKLLLGMLLAFTLCVILPVKADVWTSTTVDSAGDVGGYTSLALDGDDHPRISYYDSTDGDLKYAEWTGSDWNNVTVDSTGDVGYYSSLALDGMDYPHISYFDFTNGEVKYAEWTGSGWDISTVDSIGIFGGYTSLALGTFITPYISYYDYTNGDLKCAVWSGSGWDISTVDSTGTVGLAQSSDTSLALDGDDHPHISYYDNTNRHLKYAEWTGSNWNIIIVDSTDDVGEYSSLALDGDDHPHISYYDYTNGDLKCAVWSGSGWDISTVDSTGTVGVSSSLALGSNDYPRISYYDGTNFDLKYARWTGSDWNITTVDSTDNVGTFTSLALDSNNYPHISYYDATNGDLKYAVLVTPPSAPLDLQATAGNGYVFLSWGAPSFDGGSPVTNYKVYRGTSSGAETFLVTLANVLEYVDASVVNDQTYYYQVSAVNSAGEEPRAKSNEVSATPVIPEFPSSTILPLFMAATLLAAIALRKKKTTT